MAPAAATDQSPTRRATFSYALPAPGCTGTRISASSSPGPMTVSYGPRWNSRTGTSRSPPWPRMTAVARTPANTADRSSDGSAWHSDPPMVPHRRTIGSATTRSASWKIGNLSPAMFESSRSACRASAPMRSWPPFSLM